MEEATELIHEKHLELVPGALIFSALSIFLFNLYFVWPILGPFGKVCIFPWLRWCKGIVNESSLLMGSILASFFISVFLHSFFPVQQGSVSCHFQLPWTTAVLFIQIWHAGYRNAYIYIQLLSKARSLWMRNC